LRICGLNVTFAITILIVASIENSLDYCILRICVGLQRIANNPNRYIWQNTTLSVKKSCIAPILELPEIDLDVTVANTILIVASIEKFVEYCILGICVGLLLMSLWRDATILCGFAAYVTLA
jgi:hypothetical protein